MNQHVASLLKRFRAVYGEPKSDEPEILMAEYGRALKGFSGTVIEKAGDGLIDGLGTDGKPRRFWPSISECRDACNRVAIALAAEANRKSPPPQEAPPPPLTDEQKARHRELMAEVRRNLVDKFIHDDPAPIEIDWSKGQRSQFEAMQRNSPNRGLHTRKI